MITDKIWNKNSSLEKNFKAKEHIFKKKSNNFMTQNVFKSVCILHIKFINYNWNVKLIEKNLEYINYSYKFLNVIYIDNKVKKFITNLFSKY